MTAAIRAFMRRRWRRLALLGIAVLALLVAGGPLLRARTPAQEPATALAALALAAPVQLAAGQPFTVTVSASPPTTGTEVLLVAQGTSGLLAQSQPVQDGVARFVLPGDWSQAAGVVTLRALAGDIAAAATLTITPGTAANPLFTLTGPASVAVGGDEMPMLVALPLDALGNPVAPDAPVVVRSQPPAIAGQRPPDEMIQALTQNLLAAVRLAPHTAAGVLTAAAASDSSYSPAQSVRLMPATVEQVVIQATPSRAPADGVTRILLQTEQLADAYGNPLPDGVAVFFVAGSSDGRGRWLPAVTVSGRAAVQLTAPRAAATVVVRALVGVAASQPVTLTFTAPAPGTPFALDVTARADAVTLRAGPLLDDLGALVADGTLVVFVLTGPGGERSTRTAATQYGFAETTLYAGSLPPGAYTAEAQAGDASATAAMRMPGGQP